LVNLSDTPFLPLQDMADRHKALTPSVAASYLEAARVCLDRHHTPPKEFTLENDGIVSLARVEWQVTDHRTRAAWANTDDATRDGAYALAIATVELLRETFAVRRAETRTGADYYIAPQNQDSEDLENWLRLEVSGTDLEKSEVKRRLREKLQQAKRGKSNLPALVAIIGFKVQLAVLQTVDEVF